MTIKGLRFEKMKSNDPEIQEKYYVFDSSGNQVGCVRIITGRVICEYPKVGGKMIYAEEIGDRQDRQELFKSDEERNRYLTEVADMIHVKLAMIEQGVGKDIWFKAMSKTERTWVEGVPVYIFLRDGISYYIAEYGEVYSTSSLIKIDEQTICRYTGLKDDNGKRVYEGDIVLCKVYGVDRTEVVKWRNGAFYLGTHLLSYINGIVVHGNIHDDKT